MSLFDVQPDPLTLEDKEEWMKQLTGVSMASDAFFPFRDNIDHASKFGVQYVIQPGGSQADPQIIEACNQYGMVMVMSGVRQFTH
jgi:phosphoribosylaminoimidazolecarboxamide formyltransferase/IMP cyclohydrolase